MSSCKDCPKLSENKKCLAHDNLNEILGRPAHRIGSCMLPIVDSYLPLIKKGMKVLEVGCGSWDKLKNHCLQVGAHYEGIDTQAEYFGKKSIATRIENLSTLSFEDESFDLVVGNQTMEHWAEFGCRVEWGLYQCFRVCKQGGDVFLNVPFYFHGTNPFFNGDQNKIEQIFSLFSNNVRFEKWGHPSDPLPAIYTYPNFWAMKDKPAHLIDIRARKDRPLPNGLSNRFASTGLVSRLLNKPFEWNLFMVLRKIGVFSKIEPK